MGGYIGSKINNNGLILCLDPLNNKCYTDGNSTLIDISSTQPLTNLNGATVSSSTGEIITTGTNLSIISPNLSTLTSQLSLEFWVDVRDTSSSYSTYFTQTNGLGVYGLAIRGSDGYVLHYLGQSSASVGGWWTSGSNTALRGNSPTKWVHVVSVLDMSYTDNINRWVYIDGIERNTTTQAWTSSSIPISVNNLNPSNIDRGNRTAFYRIYNRVLNAIEVRENYKMMSKRFRK